jgi:hypothetical protein
MKIKVVRQVFTDKSTIGSLYVNDVFFCYTLEDKDRGLDQSQSLIMIQAKKLFGITAIPYGKYPLIVNKSPKFGRLLPRLQGIKGFDGVLIHRGNSAEHSHGCILVGYKKGVDCIMESTKAEADLITILQKESTHTIEIVK